MKVPTQAQRQIDRQYLVLKHGAQRHQPDADQQDDADTPQHPGFFGADGTAGLPGREQVHDLAEEGEQPGFVDRYPGTEQRKRQDVAARAPGAGPHEAQQANRWRWYLVRGEGVEPSFKNTQHACLRESACAWR
ncbi:hypothetical protein D3C80_523070 [compost metagenome]